MMVSYHPAARRWAQSCSWCSPRWSCQNRLSWRRTSCKGTRTPWQRWHSAWWRPPTRCWSAWHGRSWCGRCWSPGIELAAGRESRLHGTHPLHYAWDWIKEIETEGHLSQELRELFQTFKYQWGCCWHSPTLWHPVRMLRCLISSSALDSNE